MIRNISKYLAIFVIMSLHYVSHAQYRFDLSIQLPEGAKIDQVEFSKYDTSYQLQTATIRNQLATFTDSIADKYDQLIINYLSNGKRIGGQKIFVTSGKLKINIDSFSTTTPVPHAAFVNVPFVDELKQYHLFLKEINDSIYALGQYKSLQWMMAPKTFNRDSINQVLRALKISGLEKKFKFIRSLTNDYLGLHLLKYDLLRIGIDTYVYSSSDELLDLFYSFDSDVQQSRLGMQVYSQLKKRHLLSINDMMPMFSFFTNERAKVDLAEFRDKKFVLLCFWDSYCAPCIRNIPLLKQIASKYGNQQLQLISVSTDNKEATWKKSLERHKMPWLQTCDLPGFNNGTQIEQLYDIKYIPQYFLISPEGKLIYQNIQSGDADDYKKLQAVLAGCLAKSNEFISRE